MIPYRCKHLSTKEVVAILEVTAREMTTPNLHISMCMRGGIEGFNEKDFARKRRDEGDDFNHHKINGVQETGDDGYEVWNNRKSLEA